MTVSNEPPLTTAQGARQAPLSEQLGARRTGSPQEIEESNSPDPSQFAKLSPEQQIKKALDGPVFTYNEDEGLAISIVTEIVEPKQLSLEESFEEVKSELSNKLKKEKAMKRANEIQRTIKNQKDFRTMAKKNKLEIKGVKPFTRILTDSSDLPIPLISKIFDSELNSVNIETRGPNEIIVAQTVEIIDSLVKDKKELEGFSTRIKDDITIDLLAQFSEALRKKYKITINDDVIDQLN